MKYIESPQLMRISNFLDGHDVGGNTICCELQAYSCKLVGFDKKLSKSLDHDFEFGSSPTELCGSPLGPLAESSCRKTLIYLILTLNHVYPDHDFSVLRAHHFGKEANVETFEQTVQHHLQEVAKYWDSTKDESDEPFIETVISSIDETINLRNCDIYCYKADADADLFGDEPALWSFNYFFHNRKKRKVVYFSCRGVSKTGVASDYGEGTSEEYDYGMAKDMDLKSSLRFNSD